MVMLIISRLLECVVIRYVDNFFLMMTRACSTLLQPYRLRLPLVLMLLLLIHNSRCLIKEFREIKSLVSVEFLH